MVTGGVCRPQNGDEMADETPPNQYSGPLRIDCGAAFARGVFSRG
jgi:hypothetical protein